MKKKGFTLSELIIALGLIGVIAAITAPLIDGIMPDKNKTIFLKAYKAIYDINKDLLNDRALYREYKDGGNRVVGFADIGNPAVEPEGYNNEKQKYGQLLASRMELLNAVTIADSGNVNFVTRDGIAWVVTQGTRSCKNNECTLEHTVKIDVNGSSDGSSKTYSEDQSKPDSFEFKVLTNGQVEGSDPLAKAYLENPYKLNDKKTDYAKAATLKSSAT